MLVGGCVSRWDTDLSGNENILFMCHECCHNYEHQGSALSLVWDLG